MTSIKKQEKNKVFFDLTIPAEDIAKAETDVYKKNRSYFTVPGFRKGKAPRKIIENYYGDGIFFEDAINNILPELYDNAVEEMDLAVIDQPHIDFEEYNKGEDLIINVEVEVKPEVKLGNYDKLEIEKVNTELSKDVIENELEREREMNARILHIDDRPAESGDTVNIDFAGSVDGVAFEGGTAENQDLEIGSNTFIPGFEDQIVGKNAGEEFDVNVTFPEDYFSEELKGKEAVFKTKLNHIEKKELPEIDDEFIKDISEYDTVEEYKEHLREEKQKEVDDSAKEVRTMRVLDALVETMEVDLPPVMVENAIDDRLRNMEMNLQGSGLDLNTYLSYMGQSVDDFKATMHDDVEKDVLRNLALEELVRIENFEVTDEEIEESAVEAATKYLPDDEEKKNDLIKSLMEGDKEALRQDLQRRKAVDMLLERAVEIEKEETEEESSEEESKEE